NPDAAQRVAAPAARDCGVEGPSPTAYSPGPGAGSTESSSPRRSGVKSALRTVRAGSTPHGGSGCTLKDLPPCQKGARCPPSHRKASSLYASIIVMVVMAPVVSIFIRIGAVAPAGTKRARVPACAIVAVAIPRVVVILQATAQCATAEEGEHEAEHQTLASGFHGTLLVEVSLSKSHALPVRHTSPNRLAKCPSAYARPQPRPSPLYPVRGKLSPTGIV